MVVFTHLFLVRFFFCGKPETHFADIISLHYIDIQKLLRLLLMSLSLVNNWLELYQVSTISRRISCFHFYSFFSYR